MGWRIGAALAIGAFVGLIGGALTGCASLGDLEAESLERKAAIHDLEADVLYLQRFHCATDGDGIGESPTICPEGADTAVSGYREDPVGAIWSRTFYEIKRAKKAAARTKLPKPSLLEPAH